MHVAVIMIMNKSDAKFSNEIKNIETILMQKRETRKCSVMTQIYFWSDKVTSFPTLEICFVVVVVENKKVLSENLLSSTAVSDRFSVQI